MGNWEGKRQHKKQGYDKYKKKPIETSTK